jgi:hypothetical protein
MVLQNYNFAGMNGISIKKQANHPGGSTPAPFFLVLLYSLGSAMKELSPGMISGRLPSMNCLKPWREYASPRQSSPGRRRPCSPWSPCWKKVFRQNVLLNTSRSKCRKNMCAAGMDGYVRSDSDASPLFEADNRTFNFVSP